MPAGLVSPRPHVASSLCTHTPLVPLPPLIRTPVPWEEGPTLMTSLNLNYVPRGPVPNMVTLVGQGFNS